MKYRNLGRQDYSLVWQQMRTFTDARIADVAACDDQMWFVEHDPVFTLGRAGRIEHLLQATEIPVIKTDRGGQITYHGPGQLVVYCLFYLRHSGLSSLVRRLEQLIIAALAQYAIKAHTIPKAPGVYVEGRKIASLGLRVSRFYCYHGFAVNVNMDLCPFRCINPCGYPDLRVTQMADWLDPAVAVPNVADVAGVVTDIMESGFILY